MIVFVWTEIKICVYYRLRLQSSSCGRSLCLDQIAHHLRINPSQSDFGNKHYFGLKSDWEWLVFFIMIFYGFSVFYIHEILAYCHVELGIDAVDDYFFVSIELICLTRGC